jgi:hypothetical protein
MEPNREIKFGNIVDEEWGVKSSPKEESDNSMKWDEEGLIENKGWVSLTLYFCFTILTKNHVVYGVKIVSW